MFEEEEREKDFMWEAKGKREAASKRNAWRGTQPIYIF